MIVFTELVFDQLVRGLNTEVFSSPKFDELLGSAYDLTFELEVEETTGSPNDITLKVYHSNSGKGFVSVSTVINAASVTSLPYRGLASQAGPLAKFVRTSVSLGNSGTPSARVRIWATGRTHG